MENHPSKAAAHSQTTSTIVCDPQRIQPFESETQPTPRDKSPLTFWECATCGRRYIDPATTSLFISPPPTTECIMVQTDETWTHEKGGYVNLSVTGGATCDYVRINRAVGDADLGEHIAEPEDSASALNIPALNGLSARVCDSMKVEGEYGRVSRQNKAVDTNCDEANGEYCEFWNAECKDIDCIHEGDHCRYECAMAELSEEPEPKVLAPKRGLRFWRSVP